jgi:hypothetical protein
VAFVSWAVISTAFSQGLRTRKIRYTLNGVSGGLAVLCGIVFPAGAMI